MGATQPPAFSQDSRLFLDFERLCSVITSFFNFCYLSLTQELKLAEKWARLNRLPFPKIYGCFLFCFVFCLKDRFLLQVTSFFTYFSLTSLFQELKLAEKWARLNRLPFPKIDETVVDREGMKECYVFHDPDLPHCPVVLHFPLVNIDFRKYKAPGQCVWFWFCFVDVFELCCQVSVLILFC
jgi:hypothetical protein